MDDKICVAVFGLDDRTKHIKNALEQRAYKVILADLCDSQKDIGKWINSCDMIFLPAPLTADGRSIRSVKNEKEISNFLHSLPKVPIFCGRAHKEIMKTAVDAGLEIYDCFEQESFKIENAIPTAEAAIGLAISYTKNTLWNSKILILGYGKIGRALAFRLKNFTSSRVGVYARKQRVRTQITCDGLSAIDDLNGDFGNFNIVFNTVPSIIITKETLKNARDDCLIIDLASRPGGTDFEAAKEFSVTAVHALALPSKTAPIAAAEIFVDTALKIFNGRR